MKSTLTLILVALSSMLLAQAPQRFNYQAVVRNSDGILIKDQSVSFRMTIIEGTPSGTVKYQETQSATTNKYGLVTISIGAGQIVSGSMSSINWGADDHTLRVEIDPAGGTNFSVLSTSQLMSVPYALYALNSGNSYYRF